MIQARKRLVGVAREFFEREIPGLYSWDRIAFFEPEKQPETLPGGGRNPMRGKPREMVLMAFGDYKLEVRSSEDAPPLGSIVLKDQDQAVVEGVLDAMIWKRCGDYIKGEAG